MSKKRRYISLALSTSTLAGGIFIPGVAFAQCSPEPTQPGEITSCTGEDTNGVRVTTPGTTLTVANGATVSNSKAAAIVVDVPAGGYYDIYETIDVQGRVAASGTNAISMWSGAPFADYPYTSQNLALTVGPDGEVSGNVALALLQSPGNRYGRIFASVDNAGTLTGTSGIALQSNVVFTEYGYPDALTVFTSINNQASGRINGGILGAVSNLSNAGIIDGRSVSAIDTRGTFSTPNISNLAGGTIRSASSSATIVTHPNYYLNLTNAGTIVNSGKGAALSGGTLNVTNQDGGRIAGGIAATDSLFLINQGVVTGNVIARSGGNVINSADGKIKGSVTLGRGNNTLIAHYVGSRTLETGITGAIRAGGTNNTERVAFTKDTSVNTPIDMNVGFQRLVLAPDSDVTVTLEKSFSTSGSITLGELGTIINRATIDVVGPAVTDVGYEFNSNASFVNEGSITAHLSNFYGPAGVTLNGHAFTNKGSVSVTGGTGVSAYSNPVNNSGTIIASGTALNLYNGVLMNSGRIISSNGDGAVLYGNVGYTGLNSGVIKGRTTGVTTSIYLTNTGSIGSSGTAVAIQPYGYLINAKGGVVNGGAGGAVTAEFFNAGVANAGTINGNVIFKGSFDNANMTYIALAGGILNGNLNLGFGGTLVTDLVNAGSGQFAGITGKVTAGSGSSLRYSTSTDASATLATGKVGPFSDVGYQVIDGAVLTLTASGNGARKRALTLAGNGSIDLDANITVSGNYAIRTTSAITYPGQSATSGVLSIVSHGNIAITRTDPGYYYGPSGGIALNSNDNFINAGTIRVKDTLYGTTAAISGGATVTNSGTIRLDGGVGIFGSMNAFNTGTIGQARGGAAGTGVIVASGSFDNSGTVEVAGNAVRLGGDYNSDAAVLINSGVLTSTAGIAIVDGETHYGPVTIDNLVDGQIVGTGGTAIRVSRAVLTNSGEITGTVDLGYGGPDYYGISRRSYRSSIYVAVGGGIDGDLLFGDGDDLLLAFGDDLGVSGAIDGGAGNNIYGHSLASSGTVSLDPNALAHFQDALIQAVGAETAVTATGSVAGNLYVTGNGSVVNQASVSGTLLADVPYLFSNSYTATSLFPSHQILASLTNEGSVSGGVSGSVASFTNTGDISSQSILQTTVLLNNSGAAGLNFNNSGTIDVAPINDPYAYYYDYGRGVYLFAEGGANFTNSGQINGGVLTAVTADDEEGYVSFKFANSGAIESDRIGGAVVLSAGASDFDVSGDITVVNSGTITARSNPTNYPATALNLYVANETAPFSYTIENGGVISASSIADENGGDAAIAISLYGNGLTGTLTNSATGVISAEGSYATAVEVQQHALNLSNAGVISAIGSVASNAVLTFGDYNDVITNTGTITGAISLDGGDDAIYNGGTINGAVMLGEGDDSFTQYVGSAVSGLIDGGAGINSYFVDTSGGTTILDAAQITGFQQLAQSGSGTGIYSGTFEADTLMLSGGALQVGPGQSFATQGETTITGASGVGALSIVNFGTIGGGIALADGNDMLANAGVIAGPVALGAGDDSFIAGAGSSVNGSVDGGEGVDLYRVILSGDQDGIGLRNNFENLAVEGAGILSLTLDQDFQSVALSGTGLNLLLDGHEVGSVTGSDASEILATDGDIASISLGGGNDLVALGTTLAAGAYDGGTGANGLIFTSADPVTLSGVAVNFQSVSLTGGALEVTGTLGSSGAPLFFGDGDQSLSIANGGTLAGVVDLGAGNDSFRLAAGATLDGTVDGGAGEDAATVEIAGNLALTDGLTGFETLAIEGTGQLSITRPVALVALASEADLEIAANGSLTVPQVRFGPGDNRFTIAGGFSGSVDGGGGNDALSVSGGSEAAPIMFGDIRNFEAYSQTAGVSRIFGNAAFGTIELAGGRLIGQPGSTIAAPQILVRRGATFGSAGTVNGNLVVAGTLSPGASPGTMTVNGNVTLTTGSTSLFELASPVSDILTVNGSVSIASGATLQLVEAGPLRPGASYTLITATDGISGRFTTISKPASMFGFVVQRANEIDLLGEFLDTGDFAPQVSRSIAYLNATLKTGVGSDALIDALPVLVTASGASDPRAFGRLTPEPYASATQMGVDNALVLADAIRNPRFAGKDDDPGVFTFASTLGHWQRLSGDRGTGTSAAHARSYGFLGGVGYGDLDWSVAAFAGYLNNRQSIDGLAAQTKADGAVFGVHGQMRQPGGFGVDASVIYDGSDATTSRAVPVGSAGGRYGLHSWIGDLSVSYEIDLAGGWAVKPQIGVTYVRTSRDALVETGSSPFVLTVARDRHVAGFGDGTIRFERTSASTAALRPFVSFGFRYQMEGRSTDALAGLGGGAIALETAGAARSRLMGLVEGGIDYRLKSGVDLFLTGASHSGGNSNQESISAGVALRF